MGFKRKIAWASMLGGPAFGAVMWGAAGLGCATPIQAYYLAMGVGGLGALVSGALWLNIGWAWIRAKGFQLGPTIVIAIGLVITAAGVLWGAASWVKPQSPKSTLDHTIRIECSAATLPDTVPANGWHDFVLNDGGIIGFPNIALAPGAKLVVGGPSHPPFVNRCRFVNFGPNPVVNLEATLELVFCDAVPADGGLQSGKAVKTATISVPRISLGTGAQNFFEFYVRNAAKRLFVEVKLPKTARVQAVGKTDWQNVELIPSEYGNFILSPYD